MSRLATFPGTVLLVLAFTCPAIAATPGSIDPEAPVSYERDVRPILKAQCFHCHGEGGELQGEFDIRLRRFIVEGGWSGPAIVPGKPEESILLARIEDGEMPPPDVAEKLKPEQIEVIRRWIAAGAPTLRPEPEEIGDGLLITHEDRHFWAFQPIRRPAVPQDDTLQSEIRNEIDAFLLARLQKEGLTFTPEADRQTLIRRLSLDLIGLPPTPEEVEQFVSDPAPDAYEHLVERLLASPAYGERWGRHWLDVAGYADSEGYTNTDPEREWAWKYRDYVIRSLNADKPFDQFIVEQLAGDELVKPPYRNLTPDEIEKLVATGFLRMAPDGTGSGFNDPALARNDVVAETVNIVSSSLLGLTVGCAQCHDHRYDPISHVDYYAFRAIFDPAFNADKWRTPKQRLISQYTDADRKHAAEIEAEAKKIDQQRSTKQAEFIQQTFENELAKLPEEIREAVRTARETSKKDRTPEQEDLLKKYPSVNVTAGSLYLYDRKAADALKELAKEAADVRATKPKEEFIRALTEVPGKVPQSFLFARGDHEQPTEEVVPAALTILKLAAQTTAAASEAVQLTSVQSNGESPGSASPLGKEAPESAENSAEHTVIGHIPIDDPDLPTTGRRLTFARWLTSGEHPLTARVLVNRVWMHHFGRGIVNTPGDFGQLGERPTHPELLDWMASEFMENGWSLKQLHRLMVTSTAYRQSIRHDPKYDLVDPDNKLYGGRTPQRVEAEVLRDSILSVSGKLNDQSYGPPVPIMADHVGQWVLGIENLSAGRPGPVIPLNGEEFRRSIYVQARRSRPLAVLDAFDWPTMSSNCVARSSSTVAPQALTLMNSEFIVSYSEHFADRVRREAGDDRHAQVVRAWRLAFSRQPSEEEIDEALTFLADQTEIFGNRSTGEEEKKKEDKQPDSTHLALTTFCQVLFSSNEFLYVD